MSIIEKKGLVLSASNGFYTLECDGEKYICRCGTKIRKTDGRILSGDHVIFRDNGDGKGFVVSLLPRKNALVRPPVANIDLLAMVVAPKDPLPYLYNIDLLTVIATKYNIECAIIITKSDLFDCTSIRQVYEKTNFKVIETCAKIGAGIEEAKELLRGKVCVLCGASGVGKSTLINSIFPHLNLETGSLSEKISRGKNTTRVTELFSFVNGTYLADTPGFSSVNTELYCAIEHTELHKFFPEFVNHLDNCRYSDCTHTKETECGIADAVEKGIISSERHESYKKLYNELKNINRYK